MNGFLTTLVSSERTCVPVGVEEIVSDDAFQLRVQLIQFGFVRSQSSDGEMLSPSLLTDRARQSVEFCRDGGKFLIARLAKSRHDFCVGRTFHGSGLKDSCYAARRLDLL